jgi:vacuolar protein sorting-associated protein 72
MGGKGFLGMPPAKNVPRGFWDRTFKRAMPPPPQVPATPTPMDRTVGEIQTPVPVQTVEGTPGVREASVVATTTVGVRQIPAPVKTEAGSAS